MSCKKTKTVEKDYQDVRPLVMDFTSCLGASTILSAVFTVDPVIGDDATPTDIFDGASTIAVGGKQAVQWLQGGLVGVTYHIRCKALTDDSRELVGAVYVAVVER